MIEVELEGPTAVEVRVKQTDCFPVRVYRCVYVYYIICVYMCVCVYVFIYM